MTRKLFTPMVLGLAIVLLVAGNASAYRAIYQGGFIEGHRYFAYNANDENLLHNEIVWLAGPAAPRPIRVCVLDGIEHPAWGWWNYIWGPFDTNWADVVTLSTMARPITRSYLEANGCAVAVVGNNWHGPPAETAPPNPGGADWVIRAAEGDQVMQWLSARDTGLLVTAGSFGQFAVSGPDSNYATFRSILGVKASAACDYPGCRCAFPWSRNTGCYPGTAIPSTIVRDMTHPIVTTPAMTPASWTIAANNAAAQWMGLDGADGIMRINHSPSVSLARVTAFETKLSIEVTAFSCQDYPFKGHPTACWLTAKNTGATDIPLTVGNMQVAVDAPGFRQEVLGFEMDDTNGIPGLDPNGEADFAFVLVMPLGPPDLTFTVSGQICIPAGCAGMPIGLTTDSCKRNTDEPGDDLEVYRHFQKALVFIRTAFRNGDARYMEAFQMLREGTDDAFQDAHNLVSNTSPGPGNYNLELIHENLDEGNCQFGVTGDWLHDMGM